MVAERTIGIHPSPNDVDSYLNSSYGNNFQVNFQAEQREFSSAIQELELAHVKLTNLSQANKTRVYEDDPITNQRTEKFSYVPVDTDKHADYQNQIAQLNEKKSNVRLHHWGQQLNLANHHLVSAEESVNLLASSYRGLTNFLVNADKDSSFAQRAQELSTKVENSIRESYEKLPQIWEAFSDRSRQQGKISVVVTPQTSSQKAA